MKWLVGDEDKSSYDVREEFVNGPKHYTGGDIECIAAMRSMLSKEEFLGFLRGNIFKYHWRLRSKQNPIQDLDKAAWYEEKLKHALQEDVE
tara:strand:- start:11997 stop:12269 length:273 start_codon:yes stop_codon:yes gene_type:complete